MNKKAEKYKAFWDGFKDGVDGNHPEREFYIKYRRSSYNKGYKKGVKAFVKKYKENKQ